MAIKKNEILPEVYKLINNTSPLVRSLAIEVHKHLVELDCFSYVKTIYVGYEVDGIIVAALYPYPAHLDLALALSEDAAHPLLSDASHLTWRTLPVLATLTTRKNLPAVKNLSTLAIQGVLNGSHHVSRDNDFFIKSRLERKAKRDAVRRRPR
jgi:hypothetical protein